jgi:hypothetical protein
MKIHGLTVNENGFVFVKDVKPIVKHCKFNPISVNEVVENVKYCVDPVYTTDIEIYTDWVNELSTKTQDWK